MAESKEKAAFEGKLLLFGKKRASRNSLGTADDKKARKAELDRERQKARINIGSAVYRWETLKMQRNITKNEEIAKLLLDCYDWMYSMYYSGSPIPITCMPVSSQVAPSTSNCKLPFEQDCSTGKPLFTFSAGMPSFGNVMETDQRTSHIVPEDVLDLSVSGASKLEPVTITISDDSDDDDSGDITSEESTKLDKDSEVKQAALQNTAIIVDDLREVNVKDMDDDIEAENHKERQTHKKEISDEEKVCIPNVQEILDPADKHVLTEEDTFLVFRTPLLTLARKCCEAVCQSNGCDKKLNIKEEIDGSVLILIWICPDGHECYRWCSQPVLNHKMYGGDLLASFAVLASDNTYTKISSFAKYLRLHFTNLSTFTKIQKCYMWPTSEDYCMEK